MGNICKTIGLTRKDASASKQQTSTSNSTSDLNSSGVEVMGASSSSPKHAVVSGESKSPASASKRAESVDTNTAEIKLAFAKKQSDEAAAAAAIEVLTGPRLRLLPHQHTLFCERKQRVCAAVGQLQEMEVVKLEGFKSDIPLFSWIRIKPDDISKFNEDSEEDVDLTSFYEEIEYAQTRAEGERELGVLEYSLTREDVGYFLGVRYQASSAGANEDGDVQPGFNFITLVKHGVVKPGPPRLTEFSVTGSMQIGTMAVAEVSYIGGHEGPTEYWWMRISPEGKRTQVTEPRPIPYQPVATLNPLVADPAATAAAADSENIVSEVSEPVDTVDPIPAASSGDDAAAADTSTADSTAATTGEITSANAAVFSVVEELADPRYYKLTEADLGCCLKAKCRPTRSDGVQGEIFTSTSSEEVVAAAAAPVTTAGTA